MSVQTAVPIEFSDAAARKVKALVDEEENPNLKLRVYVTGGGCSGFQSVSYTHLTLPTTPYV